MKKRAGIAGAVLGGIAVGMGAFGAHGLKAHLTADMLQVWETAVRYQMYHALLLLLIAALASAGSTMLRNAVYSCLAGVIVFSGSLYALALTGVSKLGMITPIGGVLLILAWLFVVLHFIRSSK